MRDYKLELENRVKFIKELIINSGAKGIVFGNSGGKDSALVGIICKKACENTVGIILPCASKRNFEQDYYDGLEVAKKFNIETKFVDITKTRDAVIESLKDQTELTPLSIANVAPRIRMTTLYAYGASKNMLVAGTGNRSERFVGYFTKWGDGACDFNPISDLTVKEVYEFLEYLECPEVIIKKAPSAALFDGQTDENEMGFSYADLDEYIFTGSTKSPAKEKIEKMHRVSEHKRKGISFYKDI